MEAAPILQAGTPANDAPLGRAQKRIVLLCALVAMLDGFDTQAIAFVAPVVAAQWGLQVSAFGPVFGAGLAGLMVGALVFGPAADRWGRRRVILVTTAMFGALTLLTAWATQLPMLLALRFLTGLGLGGAMPNIIALTAENSPARSRATMVSLMFCGFPLGAVLGGLIAAKMIPLAGWQSTFWLGGLLPLLWLPALAAWLPQSQPAARAAAGQPRSVARLFSREHRARTLLLWLVFFMNLLLLNFLVNWLPSLLRQAGVPLGKAIVSTTLLNLAVIGAQISINALAAASYPAEMRSTGVGWALGIGCAGSVVGPVVGGMLLATGLSTAPLFAIAAIAAVIAGLAVLLLARNAATQGVRT